MTAVLNIALLIASASAVVLAHSGAKALLFDLRSATSASGKGARGASDIAFDALMIVVGGVTAAGALWATFLR